VDPDDSPVPDLVRGARDGEQSAWNELVERYTPLVLSVVRGYRLQGSDTDDVVQTLWLRLVEHLGDIREPLALPGWIVTTARHECLRTLRLRQRTQPFDPLATTRASEMAEIGVDGRPTDVDVVLEDLTQASRHEALLRAFAALSDSQRELLLLLMTDPPTAYAEISRRLGIPVGSIGPTRKRALQRLREHPAVRDWMVASATDEAREVG
jgi:RNA polymerase sigma factor (sigma-70 family)